MSSIILEVSAHATALLAVAARAASGRLAIGDRQLVLCDGAVVDVLPGAEDESFEAFIVKSGRVAAADLTLYQRAADAARSNIGKLLVQHGAMTEAELKHVCRAVLIDRMTRGLRTAAERNDPPQALDPREEGTGSSEPVPLVPLVLDALTRIASASEAAVVGANLNRRVEWLAGEHRSAAIAWANLGELPERPAVSTVLAKRPAAAPRIAALLRAGLIRLMPPGRTAFTAPPTPDTLPPPAPRLAEPGLDGHSERPPPPDPLIGLASIRLPRLRLDPGQAVARDRPFEATILPTLERPSLTLTDPLSEIESRIAALEASGAKGRERARAFQSLAEVWRGRYFSTERACIAYREAVAADSTDSALLQQAAVHCHSIGQHDLASRYATGAVMAAAIPVERAAAQRVRAAVERSAGNIDGCIEALCEAASDDPGNAAPHEQVAALLLERGDIDGANAHARLAAATLQDDQPERSLALLAWATSLKSHDLATAYEYASLLDASGRALASIAVLGDAAARTDDPGMRRKLRLAAAERAEAAQRPDLAVEYLEAAFDAEPHLDLLYGPLDQDTAALDDPAFRAVILEDIASACPGDQRSRWLTAAGDAVLSAEDQHEASLWLYFEALLNQPSDPVPLAAMRTHARSRRDLTLLAHGLRAAIAMHLGHDDVHAAKLLHELADLAEHGLNNGHLALASHVQLQRLGPEISADLAESIERLVAWGQAKRVELDRAEAAYQAGLGYERAELGRHVARLLPDLPEHWPRMITLLNAALAAGVDPLATREALETLHGVSRDAIALATFLEDKAEAELSIAERVRTLLRLAAVHSLRDDTAAVAAVCEQVLAMEPGCRMAIARLERAARKLGDQRRLANALQLHLSVAASPRERAGVLTRLARAQELCTAYSECAEHAASALAEDDTAVSAGLILLRHVHSLEAASALTALDTLALNMCGSRALESSRLNVAEVAGDSGRAALAIERWVALLPSDSAAHCARIRFYARGDDCSAMKNAAEAALSAIATSEVFDAARGAVERLKSLERFADAACLCLRIAEQQGKADPALALHAVTLARESDSAELITSALEHRAAVVPAGQRAEALIELAAHHRQCSDTVAELRALLRVVECQTNHAPSLERLRALFSQTGDATRLLAVVELLVRIESEPNRRRSLYLELIAIASRLLHDRDRAELYIRALVAENAADLICVREALGALLSIGEPAWALERALAIALECPASLAERIYRWCAVTAELEMGDLRLALAIARDGALRFRSSAELLLTVERITLATDDVSSAMSIYDALVKAAIGPHGHRALLYRAGRWLERAGRLDPAFDRYLAAFNFAPSGGAAFIALERVARLTGRLERAVSCYEHLTETTRDDSAKLRMLCKASEMCLDEVGDRRKGFELLLRANDYSEQHALDGRLVETAHRLLTIDPEAGAEAHRRMTEELELRVERLFAAEDKARCHLQVAALCESMPGQENRALAHVAAVLALQTTEELPVELVADAHIARASVLLRANDALGAQAALNNALSVAPDYENALSQHAEFGRRFPSVPQVQPSVAPQALAVLPSAHPLDVAPITETERRRTPTPNRNNGAHDSARPKEHPSSPLGRMRGQIRAEPWRTELLREFAKLTSGHAQRADHHAVHQILSTFDPDVSAAEEPEFHSGLWRGGSLREAIGEAQPPQVGRFLAMLWEYSRLIPQFRKGLGSFGVSERDRITRITLGPVAEAYAHAARVMGTTDVQVYIALNNAAPARALPTHPPIVLAGRGVAVDQSALLYGMARAMWLAQPEHIIGGVLFDQDATDLLQGAALAFGPPVTSPEPTSSAKELAAGLWQSVPMREQREMSETLQVHGAALMYPTLRAQTRATSARAALLTAGSVKAAVRALASSEYELCELVLSDEHDFRVGCERSPALAETVRCALSEAYLNKLARIL